MNFQGQHILSITQFEQSDFLDVFEITKRIEKAFLDKNANLFHLLDDTVIATLFYEPSTRTKLSFQSAAVRLGAQIISENGVQFSSLYKGETFYDTAQMVSQYSDLIVMRHPETGSVAQFSKGSRVPVINAGDGIGEHPTQAFLDGYTIIKDKKNLDNLHITFVGDLKYGRTVHSLVKVLMHFSGVHFQFISPKELNIPDYIYEMLKKSGCSYEWTENFTDIEKNTDVVYMTRIQKERFSSEQEYLQYKGVYILDKNVMNTLSRNSIIMHPLPRIDEILTEVDKDSRARYFQQAGNGVFVRMALLSLCLGKNF